MKGRDCFFTYGFVLSLNKSHKCGFFTFLNFEKVYLAHFFYLVRLDYC